MESKHSMMKLCLLTILSLLSILSQSPVSLSERCNPEDKQALLNIKQAFNNAYHFASWRPDTDCCDWYIVKCDGHTNRIISLDIFAADISGSIPDAVAHLPFLKTVTFHKITNLSGTIPLALTKLTNLEMLTISWTNISGAIPSDLSHLKTLKYLFLSHNSLSGSIPPSLAQLTNLDELKLDRNKLTGSIPDSFWNAPVSFKSLDLSHNQLSGGINLKTQFPQSLESLYLNHNKISGALPEGLAKAKSLTYLDVSYNRLCGRIPTGGVLQKMDYSAYFHNKCLCGPPLPNCK